MLKTKTRKQGSSIVVTLPASNISKLNSNQEYLVTYEENGTIILVPHLEDPFLLEEAGAFYEADEWSELKPLGD